MHSLFWYVHILIKSLFFFLARQIKHNFGKETRPEEKLSSDEKFEIIAIAPDGQPIEPLRTKSAFVAQCWVLVRDKFPISIQKMV